MMTAQTLSELEFSAADLANTIANKKQYAFPLHEGQTCLNLFRQIREFLNGSEEFGIEFSKRFTDQLALELFKLLR